MYRSMLSSLLVSCFLVVVVVASIQAPLHLANEERTASLITWQIRLFVRKMMLQYQIPGLTLGVVKDGQEEVEGFGFRSEWAERVSGDVRLWRTICAYTLNNRCYSTDTLRHRLLLEGFRFNGNRYPRGRLQSWKEHHSVAAKRRNSQLADESKGYPSRVGTQGRMGLREGEFGRHSEPRFWTSKV